jgi:hypothetical protein
MLLFKSSLCRNRTSGFTSFKIYQPSRNKICVCKMSYRSLISRLPCRHFRPALAGGLYMRSCLWQIRRLPPSQRLCMAAFRSQRLQPGMDRFQLGYLRGDMVAHSDNLTRGVQNSRLPLQDLAVPSALLRDTAVSAKNRRTTWKIQDSFLHGWELGLTVWIWTCSAS